MFNTCFNQPKSTAVLEDSPNNSMLRRALLFGVITIITWGTPEINTVETRKFIRFIQEEVSQLKNVFKRLGWTIREITIVPDPEVCQKKLEIELEEIIKSVNHLTMNKYPHTATHIVYYSGHGTKTHWIL
jgi:hypothetical protein